MIDRRWENKNAIVDLIERYKVKEEEVSTYHS